MIFYLNKISLEFLFFVYEVFGFRDVLKILNIYIRVEDIFFF